MMEEHRDDEKMTKRTSKRKAVSESRLQEPKKNALFTCVTARQLRAVMKLDEQLLREGENMEPKKGVYSECLRANKIGKNGPEKKYVYFPRKRKESKKRKIEKAATAILSSSQQLESSQSGQLFDVFAISIGSFVIKGVEKQRPCTVHFSFLERVISYKFHCQRDGIYYAAGYSFDFDNIVGISFTKHDVILKLKSPAKQDYCNCDRVSQTGIRIPNPCNEVDVSQGQLGASLEHIIYLKRKCKALLWKEMLLNENRSFFAPLIGEESPGVLESGCENRTTVDRPYPSEQWKKAKPTSIVSSGEDIVNNGLVTLPTPYEPQHPIIHLDSDRTGGQQASPCLQPINPGLVPNSANIIWQPLYGGSSMPIFSPVFTSQSWAHPYFSDSTSASVSVTNIYVNDNGGNGKCCQTSQYYQFLTDTESDLGFQPGEQDHEPSSVESEYTSSLSSDSEYIPQESDSQYLLGEPDMLLPSDSHWLLEGSSF